MIISVRRYANPDPKISNGAPVYNSAAWQRRLSKWHHLTRAIKEDPDIKLDCETPLLHLVARGTSRGNGNQNAAG